jgi:hypothetical protein
MGRLFQRRKHRRAGGNNKVRCRTHEFGRVDLHASEIAAGKTVLNLNVAVLRPPKRLDPLSKRRDTDLYFRIVLSE